MVVTRIRYYIFLRDVLTLALTTFGGPQAHLAHFQKMLVERRKYLTEEELMELNSLCQILPGPGINSNADGYRIQDRRA
jgi:chromate transporter